MDSRAAKRQRRLTILSSDDETEARTENRQPYVNDLSEPPSPSESSKPGAIAIGLSDAKSPTVLSSRPKSNPRQAPPGHKTLSPSPSPRKRSRGSGTAVANKSLHNFFQPATDEQRWSSQQFEASSHTVKPVPGRFDEEDDLIEDDYDSYDELFTQHFRDKGATTGPRNDAKPRSNYPRGPIQKPPPKPTSQTRKFAGSNKRFCLPLGPNSSISGLPAGLPVGDYDDRPWAQRYGPLNLEELAVHKRKVADVQTWLNDVFLGKNPRRLLVLRGPAGSGKTTTISLLSSSLGFDIVEWKNPSVTEFGAGGYTSVASQFEEFLGRGDKFGGLDLDDVADATGVAAEGHRNASSFQRRLLLIEEFPTILSRSSSSLLAFRLSLQRCLAAASAGESEGQATPIVIVVSETLLSSASSVLDNLTVHRLLGPDLYNHPGTTVIDFNSIAPSFMTKALKLVLEKDARRSNRTRVPGPSVLKSISELGDIRSAISSLEFLCVKGDQSGSWGGNVSAKAKKSTRNNDALTSMEKESLKMITQREASLGIFHAVGKIMYNKREDRSLTHESLILPPPPDHLRHHDRPKVSQVSVDELVDETGTDIQTFISALHENYVPSCDGASFTDCLDECIEALSDSDILSARIGPARSWAGLGSGVNSFSAGVDKLRQEDMSYQVAARGLLFALPYPVKRRLASTGGPGRARDSYKMFFPRSLRLWSESERIEGLTDVWMNRLSDPFRGSGFQGSHGGSGIGSSRRLPIVQARGQEGHGDGVGTAMTVTMLSRSDALLHQLPFMARISDNESDGRELELITGFHGIERRGYSLSGNCPDDLDDDSQLESFPNVDDTSVSRSLRRAAGHQGSTGTFGPRLPPSVDDQEEKLYLSDDDIEDR